MKVTESWFICEILSEDYFQVTGSVFFLGYFFVTRGTLEMFLILTCFIQFFLKN